MQRTRVPRRCFAALHRATTLHCSNAQRNDGVLYRLLAMISGHVHRNAGMFVDFERRNVSRVYVGIRTFIFLLPRGGYYQVQNRLLQKPEVRRGRAPHGTTHHKEHYSARLRRTSRNWLRYCTFCVVFHYRIKSTLYTLLKIKSKKRSDNVAVR